MKYLLLILSFSLSVAGATFPATSSQPVSIGTNGYVVQQLKLTNGLYVSGAITNADATANTAAYFDAHAVLRSVAGVGPTELGYLSGATGNVQTNIDARLQSTNGTATNLTVNVFVVNNGATVNGNSQFNNDVFIQGLVEAVQKLKVDNGGFGLDIGITAGRPGVDTAGSVYIMRTADAFGNPLSASFGNLLSAGDFRAQGDAYLNAGVGAQTGGFKALSVDNLPRLAFIGDSLTANSTAGWVTNYMAYWMPDFNLTNKAVAGATTYDVRYSQLPLVTNWLAQAYPRPSYCFVWELYNDIGHGTNATDTIANLEAICGTLTNLNAIPVLATQYKKSTESDSDYRALNDWVRNNAPRWSAIVADLQKVVIPEHGMTYDGLHPNDVGNRAIATHVHAAIRKNDRAFTTALRGTNTHAWIGTQLLIPIHIGNGGQTNQLTIATNGNIGIGVDPDANYALSVKRRGIYVQGSDSYIRNDSTNSDAILVPNGGVTAASANLSGLTASKGVFTDASKNLTSTGTLGVSQGGTGTGTAFTQGSVIFAGASGVYSQDNSNLFYDSSTHHLGIGVAADPNYSLSIGARGLYVQGTNSYIRSDSIQADALYLPSGGATIGGGYGITLSSASAPVTFGGDVGLGRSSAGVLRVTDATSTGLGALLTKRVVTNSAAGITITANRTGTVFVNDAATSLASFPLPAGASGLTYTFYVTDSDGLKITGNSAEQIRVGASISTATTGDVRSTTIGDSITIVWLGSYWGATSTVGTWTVN